MYLILNLNFVKMNKYQNGKIYIITGSESKKVYLGSTINHLKYRLSSHKSNTKKCSCNGILLNKDFNIVLLESYPCNSKKELLCREKYWFDELKSILVNKNRPSTTPEERKQDLKQHSKENSYKTKEQKENQKIRSKLWAKKNKEQVNKQKQFTFSWGGDSRCNNNLLKISIDVFE